MASAASPAAPRRLGLFDSVGLGINGIVGSGIFLLPAGMAESAGSLSVLAFALCGLLCVGVGLCFGELAGVAGERSGGPYRFAALAFGPRIGFAFGFLGLVSGFLGYATVARGLAERAVALGGGDASSAGIVVRTAAVALVVALALLNLRGARAGARLSDALSVIKLAPLLLLVAVGLPHVDPARLVATAGPGDGLWDAVWLAFFACSGFEYVSVPAAETHAPARTVPRAVIGSIVGVVTLYVLVQLVVVGALPGLSRSAAPLEDAASALLGPSGRLLLAAGAVVSMLGFVSGSALVVPRSVQALAADGHLPGGLARTDSVGTPRAAIVLVTLVAGALAALVDFRALVDFSTTAILAQFVPTCVALIVLRRRGVAGAGDGAYRMPGVPVLPLALVLALGALLARKVGSAELLTAAAIVGLGLALRALAARGASGSCPGPAGG